MKPAQIHRVVPLALLAAVLATIVPDAAAQSPADLRRENQALKTKVADLELQYEAAVAKIRELEAEIARLHAAAGGTSPTTRASAPPSPEKPVTIDETDPAASPRAVLAAIRSDYADIAEDLTEPPAEGEEMSTAYRRTLDRFTRKINRSYRLPIDWHVRVVDRAVPVARGFMLRLQAVDPVSGAELGAPFDTRVGKSLASRLQAMDKRGRLDEVMLLKGTLVPVVRVNPERREPGAFDNPPLVAPFLEFRMAVEAQTMLPRPVEKKDDAKPARPAREKAAGDRK